MKAGVEIPTWLTRFIDPQKLIFFSGGLANTLLTFGLYNALLFVFSYPIAYYGSYGTGILFSYLFNSTLTFRSRQKSILQFVQVAMLYTVLGFAGHLILLLCVEIVMIHESLAIVFVAASLFPLNFFAMKLVFKSSLSL